MSGTARDPHNSPLDAIRKALDDGEDWRFTVRLTLNGLEEQAWKQGYLAGLVDARARDLEQKRNEDVA